MGARLARARGGIGGWLLRRQRTWMRRGPGGWPWRMGADPLHGAATDRSGSHCIPTGRRSAALCREGSGGAGRLRPKRRTAANEMTVALRAHRGAAGAEMAQLARNDRRSADGGMQARTLATPDQRRWYSRACTHAQRIDIGWKGRIRSWKELGASEDRSKAERGGCDRRGF